MLVREVDYGSVTEDWLLKNRCHDHGAPREELQAYKQA